MHSSVRRRRLTCGHNMREGVLVACTDGADTGTHVRGMELPVFAASIVSWIRMRSACPAALRPVRLLYHVSRSGIGQHFARLESTLCFKVKFTWTEIHLPVSPLTGSESLHVTSGPALVNISSNCGESNSNPSFHSTSNGHTVCGDERLRMPDAMAASQPSTRNDAHHNGNRTLIVHDVHLFRESQDTDFGDIE